MGTFVDIVDAAYAIERDEEAWLDGLMRALGDMYGDEAAAYVIRPETTGRERFGAMVCRGRWRRVVEDGIEVTRSLPLPIVRALYADAPFAGLANRRMREVRAAHDVPAPLTDMAGFRNGVGVLGVYGGSPRSGCMLVVRTGRDSLGARTQASLRRVAAHVAAAFRLRESGLSDPLAMVDEEGRWLEGEQLEGVADAARAIVEAKREGAIEIWQGLVAGRWSLVRHCDRGGRRHLVLHRNEIEDAAGDDDVVRAVSSVLALAARGHSNKFIAYELGLPTATVASHLRRGLAKLGLSRAELVRALA